MATLNGNPASGRYNSSMPRKSLAEQERERQARLRRDRHRQEERVTPHLKPDRLPTYFRQWRKYRKMTLEEAGEAAEMTAGNISAMERGAQGYTQAGLEALAKAYDCLPGQLLMVDPLNSDIWSLWELAKTGLPNKEPDKAK